MGKHERHHWYKSPARNPLNGRIMSVPYGADEFHVEPCDLRFSDVMLEIYRPYVEKTAISFELEVPTEDEFTERVRRGLKSPYPWLLACVPDKCECEISCETWLHADGAFRRLCGEVRTLVLNDLDGQAPLTILIQLRVGCAKPFLVVYLRCSRNPLWLPSGCPVIISDFDGNIVDKCSDSGDNPKFIRKWNL